MIWDWSVSVGRRWPKFGSVSCSIAGGRRTAATRGRSERAGKTCPAKRYARNRQAAQMAPYNGALSALRVPLLHRLPCVGVSGRLLGSGSCVQRARTKRSSRLGGVSIHHRPTAHTPNPSSFREASARSWRDHTGQKFSLFQRLEGGKPR